MVTMTLHNATPKTLMRTAARAHAHSHKAHKAHYQMFTDYKSIQTPLFFPARPKPLPSPPLPPLPIPSRNTLHGHGKGPRAGKKGGGRGLDGAGMHWRICLPASCARLPPPRSEILACLPDHLNGAFRPILRVALVVI